MNYFLEIDQANVLVGIHSVYPTGSPHRIVQITAAQLVLYKDKLGRIVEV